MNKLNIQTLLNEYCFVVPEIQREYVWGNKVNELVVTQFLKDIDDKVGRGDANIGFLYSYKSGGEHYLIDGQQRYTTLILLLHYTTVKEGTERHSEYIKMHRLDNNVSAFAYRVRSQTDSFLKNLLISSATNTKMIKQQKWYKSVYDDDVTVHSMMDALDVIDKLSENGSFSNLSSDNILNRLFFWYFDVDQTSQGEELYITMNSRGEKLTDSEQIKPRLLNKVNNAIEKEKFGTKWDNWEEFFFSNRIRHSRKIETIDTAMNNVIRLVLEMKTCGEHDKIKPIEDAELICIEDVERYMLSIEQLSTMFEGRYCSEIERLYGDTDGDGNFVVLKALLTEIIRNQDDWREFERIYQTMMNHVRRNKVRNVDVLLFLKEYSIFDGSFYDFILHSNSENAHSVVNGHELDKVLICSNAGDYEKEKTIWDEQSNDFWNGEMKILLNWSRCDGIFSFEAFNRIRANFHKLFKQKFEKEDWTTDTVRQALIAYRLPKYPLGEKFGYYRDEWKEIFSNNSQEMLAFINCFDGVALENVSSVLDSIRQKYDEVPENPWAEFVKYNYFLGYCNTKHLNWNDNYGWILVRNSWAKPFSVRNMRLFHDLKNIFGDNINGWNMWKYISWDSCVCIQNDNLQIYTDIRWMRKDNDFYYLKVSLSKRNVSSEGYGLLKDSLLSFIPTGITMEWNNKEGVYTWKPASIEELHHYITSITSHNG